LASQLAFVNLNLMQIIENLTIGTDYFATSPPILRFLGGLGRGLKDLGFFYGF